MPGEFDVGARLREARQIAGLTQRQLAERAGVPHSQISMVKQNHSSPSVASLCKILGGVPMTMAAFFEPDRGLGARIFFSPEKLLDLTSRLSPGTTAGSSCAKSAMPECTICKACQERYEPGADTGPSMLEHASHEGSIVIAGEIELTVGSQVRLLRSGGAYLFDSRRPHRFRNRSDRPAELVSACTPPYL